MLLYATRFLLTLPREILCRSDTDCPPVCDPKRNLRYKLTSRGADDEGQGLYTSIDEGHSLYAGIWVAGTIRIVGLMPSTLLLVFLYRRPQLRLFHDERSLDGSCKPVSQIVLWTRAET